MKSNPFDEVLANISVIHTNLEVEGKQLLILSITSPQGVSHDRIIPVSPEDLEDIGDSIVWEDAIQFAGDLLTYYHIGDM